MSRRFRYRYEPDGFDEEGEKIPDIPVVYLVLETEIARAKGPAVVDTGFDGGVYPNFRILRIFEELRPAKVKRVEHPLYGFILCEVFKAKASLADSSFRRTAPIGAVNVYTPMEPEYLTDEVLVGREILNNLKIKLDGTWTLVWF